QGTPSKLLTGPWSHLAQDRPVGDLNFGFGSQAAMVDLRMDLAGIQLRWFDHWLKSIDTGMMAEAPIKLFVMGANIWRDEQEWPLARAVENHWYLHAGGELSEEPPGAEPPDRYAYDPAHPVPTIGGATLMAAQYPAGPRDQREVEARHDVLVYRS